MGRGKGQPTRKKISGAATVLDRRPLGYPRVTPTCGEPPGPGVPDPLPREGFPSGVGVVGTYTGPAYSVAMDSGSLATATLDLTGIAK